MSLRAYIDTSVFGGYFDVGFDEASRRFFEMVEAKQILPLISDVLLAEIGRAPEPVRDLLVQVISGGIERLAATEEAIELQEAYLRANVVSMNYADDALHIAQATLARADVVVSWNFRHLVNPTRIRGFNGINVAQGYGLIVILTPIDIVRIVEAEYGDE